MIGAKSDFLIMNLTESDALASGGGIFTFK